MTNLSVSPMKENEIQYMVDYWFNCSNADLERMGVDKAKLSSKEKFHNDILASFKHPIEDCKSFYMIWYINNEPVGHNAFRDIVKGELASMHLHIWVDKYRGKGFGAKLFCLSALEFYKLYEPKLILCEPAFHNPMPNRMLQKIGYKIWRTNFSKTGYISAICENTSYIIDKETSLNYLNRN